ncbi:phosphoenolpyruvate carboxykinase (ATP) [Sphaceloma murrayae]|uniref:Phosphoenolpyruvate carboxykinase (ATP) n=1 Tax=Sphaceloma murrayae TaxID=2082308 RepID=A0A2K1QG39_9PEZI|nr:phosphoenolpyruvate carboxykinase (ATP) [Sphaceloma murrayae]
MSIPGFERLTKSIYTFSPQDAAPRPDDPDVVLLFSWLGAATRHVAKYIVGYKQLYPSARIVLMRSEFPDMVLNPKTAERNAMSAIKAALDGHEHEFSKHPSKILVHVWSNGGAFNFQGACKAWARETGTKFDPQLLILDSTPGSDRFVGAYSKALNLMKAILPKTLFSRLFGYAYAVLFVFTLFVLPRLRGYISLPTMIRRGLNDTSAVPTSIPRAYFYSDGDDLIESDWVEKHGKDAMDKGYTVQLVPHTNTQHVAHMRADPGLYWSRVAERWNEATAPPPRASRPASSIDASAA